MTEKMRLIYVDPRGLKRNAWNPNQLTPEAEAKLRKSIEENGITRPIVVRELDDGSLEIVGGAHRNEVFIDLGFDEVPVLNLGKIDDVHAKKALLIDNARYGEDDPAKLADLLLGIGSAKEIESWLNMDLSDLETLIGLEDVGTDELELLDDLEGLEGVDEESELVPTKEVKTHQIMKFKVPVENADFVRDRINSIVKTQGLDDSDAGINAGDALVWLCRSGLVEVEDEVGDELELSIESMMAELEE